MTRAMSIEGIAHRIFLIRSHKVMLDSDLAELYGVATRILNQQVRRNVRRFPADFMFRLTPEVTNRLRSQIVISNIGRGGRRYLPYVFTQEGVAMLSSVLSTRRAVQANVAIMRAFVRLRETLALHKDLARKLDELERRIEGHDAQIQSIFDAIRGLMTPPEEPKRRIGFLQERRIRYGKTPRILVES